MKKLLLVIALISGFSEIKSQGYYDALLFSKEVYQGSARSIAMGNAFTSLGGDLGAIGINPASSALYSFKEIVFSPSISIMSNNVNYLGATRKETPTYLNISNFGSIATSEKGSSKSRVNFAVAINRVGDYNQKYSASGKTAQSSWLASLAVSTGGIDARNMDINNQNNPYYDYPNIPWKSILAWNSNLLDTLPDSGLDYIGATENIIGNQIVIGGELQQRFWRETSGGNDEIVLNVGGTLSSDFYYGINLGIKTLVYSDYQIYSETATNPSQFQSLFSSFQHIYSQKTEGVGFNVKAGFIWKPTDGIRVGASFASPTWYSMSDEWYENIQANYSDGYNRNLTSPLGYYEYRLTTPMKVNAGISFFAGKNGLISFDYELVDYTTAKFSTKQGDYSYSDVNDDIKTELNAVNNFRAGLEYKIDSGLALRAGYSFYQNPEVNFGNNLNIVSVGAGIRKKSGIFMDLALQKKLSSKEQFSLYSDTEDTPAPIGEIDNSGVRAVVTFGLRF